MLKTATDLGTNTNPLAFEELVTSLASLHALAQGESDGRDMQWVMCEFRRLYSQALRQPPNFHEITELAGDLVTAGDYRAGRAAWLLLNINDVKIYGVHSLVWHKVQGKYRAPMLEQLSIALSVKSKLTDKRLQAMGRKTLPLDVFGVKDGEIWLVQSVYATKRLESAVAKANAPRLFKEAVFQKPELDTRSLVALESAYNLIHAAFPSHVCRVFALVIHPKFPDFELYQIEPTNWPNGGLLSYDNIVTDSLDHEEKLQHDHESLWTLPRRLNNDLFLGLPPCRGGRTLSILASVAKKQLLTETLLVWKESQVAKLLMDDFGYHVPRDKVRHDLLDRLVGQGFMRKRCSIYYLSVKGMARYQYCLAKYTTRGPNDAVNVLDICTQQRNRIFNCFGYL